jgi:hypothetical protein
LADFQNASRKGGLIHEPRQEKGGWFRCNASRKDGFDATRQRRVILIHETRQENGGWFLFNVLRRVRLISGPRHERVRLSTL